MTPMIWSIVIFAVSIVLYATHVIPMGLTSLLSVIAFVMAGCLESKDALSCFADPTAVIYASMYVLAAGFNRTSFMDKLSSWIIRASHNSMRRVWLSYILLAGLLTSMIPSPISAFVVVAPLCVNSCKKFGEPPAKYLFALAAVCIGCCFTLPFGSAISQSALSTSFFETYGMGQYVMQITDPMKGRWPFVLILLLWAYFLAPKFAPELPDHDPSYHMFSTSSRQKPLSKFADIAGPVIFLLSIVFMVIGRYIGIETWMACMAGALMMVLCGVLTEKEAVNALPMSLIFIFVGALATGKALISTGAGDYLGGLLATVTGNTKSNLLIGVIAYLIPYLLTQVLLNSGVSALVRPVLLLICASLDANPVGPMILMLSATVSSFMSPMATPVVPACMELGGLSSKNLIKQGWWISIILAVVQILWVMHVFPAF